MRAIESERIYKVLASRAPSRLVLQMLHFGSFFEFSKTCGINHETLAALFYKKSRHRKYFSSFARVFECLTSGYKQYAAELPGIDRAYAKAWIRNWAKTSTENNVQLERLAARKMTNKYEQKRRYARIEANRAKLKRLIETF